VREKIEPVAGPEFAILASEMERDGSRYTHQYLVVRVLVPTVFLPRTVGPGIGIQSLGFENRGNIFRGHRFVREPTRTHVYIRP